MDILDKMKEGLSKGIETIGTKGKELVEGAQLQLQLSSLREKRQKAVEALGALAYALAKTSPPADPEAQRICAEIAEIERQIELKEAESKHAPLARTGPTAVVACECGTTLERGVNFCSACGKKVG